MNSEDKIMKEAFHKYMEAEGKQYAEEKKVYDNDIQFALTSKVRKKLNRTIKVESKRSKKMFSFSTVSKAAMIISIIGALGTTATVLSVNGAKGETLGLSYYESNDNVYVCKDGLQNNQEADELKVMYIPQGLELTAVEEREGSKMYHYVGEGSEVKIIFESSADAKIILSGQYDIVKFGEKEVLKVTNTRFQSDSYLWSQNNWLIAIKCQGITEEGVKNIVLGIK